MRLRSVFIFMLLFVSTVFSASAEEAQFNVRKDALLVSAGRVETLDIQVQLPKGFHAFSDKFKVSDINPPNFNIGQLKVLSEIDFYDRFSNKNRKGIKESGQLKLQIEAPIDFDPQIKKLSFNLQSQICSEKVCYLPTKHKVEIPIRFVAADEVNQIIESTVITEGSQRDLTLLNRLENALAENIWYAFIIAFIAGILTSFTPCIFPMIPITISVLGHDAEKNSRIQNFARSLLYVLGIACTYSFLGVLAALTGNLFGNALSNKYVLISLVVLFFTMALSMWGVFELQVPAIIRNKLGVGKRHGYLGVFVMGLISGIVASPCVGPVLVSILSYVSTTKDAALGFGLLFTYAIGLGLIFIVIGLFGQAVSMLPRSGRWMSQIKYLLGLLMFLMAIYYFLMAFPMQKTKVSGVKWQAYSEELLAQAKGNSQPVLIDFRADWCYACLELEDKTFSTPGFKDLSASFMLLKVDATEDTSEVQAIIKKYNVKGLPTVLFLNKKGAVISELTFTQFLEWSELEPKMRSALEH